MATVENGNVDSSVTFPLTTHGTGNSPCPTATTGNIVNFDSPGTQIRIRIRARH